MQYISGYSSSDSSSNSETDKYMRPSARTGKRGEDYGRKRLKTQPPPPDILESTDLRNKTSSSSSAVALPAVVPHEAREDRYLIHVFIPVDALKAKPIVMELMGRARLALVGSPVKASFSELTNFHVSLSRPTTIRSNQISELVRSIHHQVALCKQGVMEIKPIISALLSQNRRRLFLGAPARSATTPCVLSRLIRGIDDAFQVLGLPAFFEDPKPHMSFAWTETVEVLPQYMSGSHDSDTHTSRTSSLMVPIEKLECTIGRSQYTFPLADNKAV